MRKLLIVAAFGLIIFAVFTLWWRNGISAVDPKDTSTRVFVIPKGAAVRTIGNELKAAGLIKDPVAFFIYIKQNNLDQGIQAGSYKLSRSMDLPKIMDTIGHGTVDVWVTIPEGYRSEEIAEVLQKEIPSYKADWVPALKAEEGYLFPDTYLVPKDAEVSTVISIFKSNFNKKIEGIGLSSEDPKLNDIVTIASLIERESLKDGEKALIASVINNRLDAGMALDIDATLQYVKGKNASGKWWTVPTAQDRSLVSSYNTYKNPGLPPGPIANPGIEALRAAKNPASSGYYFYLHDSKGNIHFAETLEAHNENIAKYLN